MSRDNDVLDLLVDLLEQVVLTAQAGEYANAAGMEQHCRMIAGYHGGSAESVPLFRRALDSVEVGGRCALAHELLERIKEMRE